jgi:insulysin
MCHERKDLPGLAHFLEHMLFTGSAKYPSEGEYHEFIQQNGGSANAYTACFKTSYMLEVKPEALEDALDRFSRFFTEPCLTRSCTEREINAVDSEFQAGHTMPWWRYIGIMNQSANPEHPFHVAVGNLKCLRDEPKERGVDLYDEMKKFYDACYSANGMTLCVIGKESTKELQNMIREKFGSIVNKGVTMPIGDAVSEKPPFLPKDWHQMLLQCPVKDVKELSFSWVLPYQGFNWKTKPFSYVSHLLGCSGKGSIIAALKEKGLISGCCISNGDWLQGAFTLLNIDCDLTDKGLDHIQEIGTYFFTFLGMLQKIPTEKWLWDEMSQLQKVQFKFGEDKGAFSLAAQIAESLQTHPPSEALAGGRLLYEYEEKGIQDILSQLTLDTVRVQHSSKTLSDRCTDKDTSYESPMAFVPIETEWLNQWATALNPGNGSAEASVEAAAQLGMHIRRPNPFIPEDLSVRDLPAEPPALPQKLHQTPVPVCVFHRQDDIFKQPKAYITFHIRSPFIVQDAESFMKTELWCRILAEDLNEYAYDAKMAGVRSFFGCQDGLMALTVWGFDEKLAVLISTVAKRMRARTSVPEATYNIVADAYRDALLNAAFQSRPIQQCSMRWNQLTTRGTIFPAEERYKAFQKLSKEGLDNLPDRIFNNCHVEAMVLGNATPEDAQSLAASLADGLSLKGRLSTLPVRSEATLPPGRTVWTVDSADENDPNHAVLLAIQLTRTLKNDMMLCMLEKVLAPKFFDDLRTQQQLGYLVGLGSSSRVAFSYLIAQVQTEFPVEYVRSRIDAFLDEQFEWIKEGLTEEEFQMCKGGLLAELHAAPKNLNEEAGNYLSSFTNRSFDFDRRQRMIEFVEGLTSHESLLRFVNEEILPAPRLYTMVKKTLAKEDKAMPEGAVIPEDSTELRRWSGPVDAVVESFGSMAVWVDSDSKVDGAAKL